MAIPYNQKENKRAIGSELLLINEQHVIGVTGVSTVTPNTVRLIEVPLQELPSTVVIPGYVETTSTPAGVQFLVDYKNGRITFDPSQNGLTVFVTYKGRGSIIDAEDVNELQEPVQAVVTDFGTLGSPNYGLANDSVTPNTISTAPSDDFTFPNDVTVTGDILASSRIGINISPSAHLHNHGSTIYGLATAIDPVSIPASTVDDKTGIRVTTTGPVVLTLPTPTDTTLGRIFNVIHTVASTGTLSIDGNPIDLGSGSVFEWDGTHWIPLSSATTLSTANSFQVVAVLPGAPNAGDVVFLNTTNQFMGYNGSIWVLLG